jgi:hypothetical protein
MRSAIPHQMYLQHQQLQDHLLFLREYIRYMSLRLVLVEIQDQQEVILKH